MDTIHVIGDSHVGMFFGERNHSVDPMTRTFGNLTMVDLAAGTMAGTTVFGLTNPNPRIDAPKKIKMILSSGVTNVAMVLGEVDVRWHIWKHRGERSIEEAVGEVVARYESFLSDSVAPCVSGKLILFGGIPHSEDYAKQVSGSTDPPLHVYTTEFDLQVEQMARKNGWEFVSILKQVRDGKEYVSSDKLSDEVHLDCRMTLPFILEKLEKIFDGPVD